MNKNIETQKNGIIVEEYLIDVYYGKTSEYIIKDKKYEKFSENFSVINIDDENITLHAHGIDDAIIPFKKLAVPLMIKSFIFTQKIIRGKVDSLFILNGKTNHINELKKIVSSLKHENEDNEIIINYNDDIYNIEPTIIKQMFNELIDLMEIDEVDIKNNEKSKVTILKNRINTIYRKIGSDIDHIGKQIDEELIIIMQIDEECNDSVLYKGNMIPLNIKIKTVEDFNNTIVDLHSMLNFKKISCVICTNDNSIDDQLLAKILKFITNFKIMYATHTEYEFNTIIDIVLNDADGKIKNNRYSILINEMSDMACELNDDGTIAKLIKER